MLFEHSESAPQRTHAGTHRCHDLSPEEWRVLVDGLAAVSGATSVDALAQDLLSRWDGLTVDERVAALAIIAGILASRIQ
jgi:hypothetical protein